MKSPIFRMNTNVKQFPGKATWFFAMLPKKESAEIDKLFIDQKKGWQSLPVEVSAKQSTWKTSIFFNKKEEIYMLPLKKCVRDKEEIREGDQIEIQLSIQL